MFRPEDVDAYNKDVNGWTKSTHLQALAKMDQYGITHSEKSRSPVPLRKALKTVHRKNAGVINRISFRLPRHGIFRHKGVGRGTKISQVGSTKRQPADFLNDPLEKNIGKLSELVADHQGTMVVNALMIK